ncbi:unnamed protein product [Arctia plantaginis]|uniref:Uncharacterized protein n=1 Tax=Arctia plantaginis TaxID=874455 RepID=A0A8S0Z1U6_ARCPL|nr:unnamed protein product [Arctia plantaginis]
MKGINVLKIRTRASRNTELQLRNKYLEPPEISGLKKKDLISLCDSNVIPRVYRGYYARLEAADSYGADR